MAWTDSHCHVQYDGVGLEALAAGARVGVTRVVCIGTDAAHSAAAVELARAGAAELGVELWATVGVHPHEATEGIEGIVPLLGDRRVVAVGECGLDYHYDHSPRDVQRRVFAEQVALARRWGLALVVHTRDAWEDTFAVLGSEGVPERTVFHCFTGGPDEAGRALDLGACLSFSGIVTFKSADDVRGAAAICPLDRLLVETDAPYLAPVPHRGAANGPAYLPLVGAGVAAAKRLPVEEVEQASWSTAERVFGFGV